MARCEDFPCCGHELGCCPDYDEAGRQRNMRCTCGAILPLNNRVSICKACLKRMAIEDGEYPDDYECEDTDYWDDEDNEYDKEDENEEDLLPGEDMDGDHDSCMRDIGWGTEEDYGYGGDDY